MSHTVHPYAHRIGIIRGWKSRWFAVGDKYNDALKGDIVIREFLQKRLKGLSVAGVEIERGQKTLRIIVKTARPGLLIGRSGEGIQKLRTDLLAALKRRKIVVLPEFKLDVEEVRSPESNAAIVAGMVVEGLEKRLPFRRILKQTAEKAMNNRDVKGVRIALGGILGGSGMARREVLKKGNVPLQTFRADIDFARAEANLPLGVVGVKVWIYRGEIYAKAADKRQAERA